MAEKRDSMPVLADGEERRRYLLSAEELTQARINHEMGLHRFAAFQGAARVTYQASGDVELILQGKFTEMPDGMQVTKWRK